MIKTLRTFLEKTYAIPGRNFLWVNIALAGFVALAHGGALAVTYVTPTPMASEIRQLALISLPVVAVVLITAAGGLISTQLRLRVLALHGIVFAAGESFLLLWALGVLFNGLPQGRFSWSVGFLSASACYASVLFCRFSIPMHLRSSWGAYYAPVFALACAVPLDFGVLIRVVG